MPNTNSLDYKKIKRGKICKVEPSVAPELTILLLYYTILLQPSPWFNGHNKGAQTLLYYMINNNNNIIIVLTCRFFF